MASTAFAARHEILGLQLLAAAGREAHAEVRQPLVPRPGTPICSVQFSAESSTIGWTFVVAGRAPKNSCAAVERRPLLDAALDPDLVDPALLPIGEQADAVAGRDDVLEVISDLRHRQIEVHVLSHRERRLHVQRDLGDDAERAETDDRRLKRVAVLLRASGRTSPPAVTISSADTAVERFPLFTPEPCVPVAQAPAIGDVRQRGEVVQREALLDRETGTAGRSSCPTRP